MPVAILSVLHALTPVWFSQYPLKQVTYNCDLCYVISLRHCSGRLRQELAKVTQNGEAWIQIRVVETMKPVICRGQGPRWDAGEARDGGKVGITNTSQMITNAKLESEYVAG